MTAQGPDRSPTARARGVADGRSAARRHTLELSLLAARVSAIIRRHLTLAAGGAAVPLDEFDRSDLQRARDLLHQVVALSFPRRRAADTSMRALVSAGVALSAAQQQSDAAGKPAPTDAAALLSEVADHLDAIGRGEANPEQGRALSYFEQLAAQARRSSATNTESVIRGS